MLEERASFSPDALTGMEANLRFAGPETMETQIFGRLTAWQNWIFQRPNAVGEKRRAEALRQRVQPDFDPAGLRQGHERYPMHRSITDAHPEQCRIDDDPRVRKALESWHPGYIDWWKRHGARGFQEAPVYLRTAVTVDPKGWAKFDYVRMPEYRWGVLLAHGRSRKIISAPIWASRPGRTCPANTAPCCAA